MNNSDRPREGSVDPSNTNIAWFRLYSAWAAINDETNTTQTNQTALANPTRWNPFDQTWDALSQQFTRTIYDPTLRSTGAVGDLVRCAKSSNGRWEVMPEWPTSYVEYRMSSQYNSEGFDPLDYRLDVSYPLGYVGARARAGSELAAGIAYDDAATPSTDGNFLVNRTGLYRIDVRLLLEIDWTDYSTGLDTVYTTTTVSSHSHEVTVPSVSKAIDPAERMGILRLRLYRKPSGGAMAPYEDEAGVVRQWEYEPPIVVRDCLVSGFDTWWVSLTAGDRITFPLGASSSEYRDHFVRQPNNAGIWIAFTYQGPVQTWASIL